MKRFALVFTAIALALMLAAPASAAVQHFVAQVYKQTADRPDNLTLITSGITYQVLATGSDTAETIYSDPALTAKTNPVTATVFNTQDRVDFYCDPTDADDNEVDLLVVDTAGGYTVFIEDFDIYRRTIVIDERPNVLHHGVIWFVPDDNTGTDTGVDFLPDTLISDVIVEVVTVDATETISIGTADTATGFRSGVSVATAGYVADTAIPTNGSNIDYFPVTTYGALLATAITGSDAVATNGGIRTKPHIVTTAGTDDDLVYTGSAGSDTAAGYIHYWFMRLR